MQTLLALHLANSARLGGQRSQTVIQTQNAQSVQLDTAKTRQDKPNALSVLQATTLQKKVLFSKNVLPVRWVTPQSQLLGKIAQHALLASTWTKWHLLPRLANHVTEDLTPQAITAISVRNVLLEKKEIQIDKVV